jgi:hypothetical protein
LHRSSTYSGVEGISTQVVGWWELAR